MEHLSTFGLSRDPFANEPQLDLFFESQTARDAAGRLRRAAQQAKGLVVLTAPGGLGKTMLVRHLLDGLEEEVFEACLLVPVPGVSDGAWVFDRLARQLGIEAPARDRAALLGEVYERLAIVREDGRHTVVILDEAQVLAEQGALAELRGLLNLEYEDRRLVTLVLVGLPSLMAAVAAEPALADRIDVPLRIGALRGEEASRYLTHRIRAAGGNPAILESGAVAALVKWGGGSPRQLNRLADAALFEAHLAGRVSATAEDVERAAAELELASPEAVSAAANAPLTAANAPLTAASASLTAASALFTAASAPLAASSADCEVAVKPRGAPAAKPLAPSASKSHAASAAKPLDHPVARPVSAAAAPRTPSPARSLGGGASRAPARELPPVFEEAEAAIELEEVVATGTDPMRGNPAATVALFGDVENDDGSATMALFADADELGAEPIELRGEDSGQELDDLFADLVKD